MTWKGFSVALTILLALTPQALGQTLIVHTEQPAIELSRTRVRALFAMRIPQWPDGTPVRVFVLADTDPLHVSFCKSVLGMFPYQLRRIWDRQVFSGTGIAPVVVASESEMLARVSRTRGAIGYLSHDAADDSVLQLRVGL